MPKAVYTLSWSAASQTYVLSGPPSEQARSLAPDSPAWFAWLAERSSFAFHGQAGSYSALLEAVQRGEHYWYAYRRTGQKVRKKYLGKTADLTLARLEQVARLLQTERASAVVPGTTLPTRKAHQDLACTPQVVTPAPVVKGHIDAATALPAQPLQPHLATKFYVPRPLARLVPRSRLLARLRQGLSQPLILLCAPAGFGKTTLLVELLADCGVPAAWLSLDPEDNDPQRFLSALLAAFQTRDPSIGASLQVLLSTPHGLQGLSLSAVFTLLINDLASRACGEFLLVLDDYHTITLDPIQHAIASLVEHCPPTLHLVIATRADPPLALARLRARGQLCELRAADLQFDTEEARHFLHTALGRELSPSTLATILTWTEGWIAGLQLTVLSLQARRTEAEVRQFLADSVGSQRHLVDYLTEEVVAQQPEAVQSFLLHTSILEPLSASLCAAVTEAKSSAESEALLSFVEQANLFLFPLDEQGEWYRYHPLWASVLRVLLLRKLGAAGVAALYERASRWYEQHDLPSEAIEAAMQAGAFERAVQLVDQLSPLLLARSQYYTLRRWIERLPRELWAARPIVCLAYAWALFLSGAQDAYVTPLEEAERLFRREEKSVGVGMVEALRAMAALLWADGREALRASQQALALLSESDLLLRNTCLNVVGGGYWLMGEVETAWRQLQEARVRHEQTGHLEAQWLNRMLLGHVLVLKGQLHEAAECYQQVIESAAERREYSIHCRILLASIWYEWNALQEAEAQLAEAIAESPSVVASTFFARGVLSLAFVLQARIKQAQGEHEAARSLLRQAMTVAQQQQHPQFLAHTQAAQVRFWLAQGQGESVTRWREAWVHTDDITPRYEDELGALTLARVLIAEGKPEEVLRLLEGFRVLARTQRRLSSELEILVLCALAEARRGKTESAVQHLQQALALAEPTGYVRLFLDEGPELLPLLRLVLSRGFGRRRAHYVQQVLTLLEAEHPEQVGSAPDGLSPAVSRISGRELAVLRGLVEGLSTAQLAARLVVSPNTIKTHLASLYRKLDVRTREAALAEAVRLHLL